MSQTKLNQIVSLKGSGATIPAYVVLKVGTGTNQVAIWDTATALIVGVSADSGYDTNSAIPVVIGGTAKVICGASVSCGAILTVQTATGYAIEGTNTLNTTTTAIPRVLGVALQGGATGSVIEVALQINNVRIAIA